jgi:hypothetical protein
MKTEKMKDELKGNYPELNKEAKLELSKDRNEQFQQQGQKKIYN